MADTYFGIGKLNFFVFIVVYFMVVGVVGAVFDPVGKGLVPTDDSLAKGAKQFDTGVMAKQKAPKADIWGAFGMIGGVVSTGLGIFWIGMTFDIPGIPDMLRLFLTVPVLIVFFVVIIDILMDIIKTVKPSWL